MVVKLNSEHFEELMKDAEKALKLCAASRMYPVPFMPKNGGNGRFDDVSIDDPSVHSIFGSVYSYSMSEIMQMQYSRYDGKNFANGILTVYGFMMMGIVAVYDAGELHLYTLNPCALNGFCKQDDILNTFSRCKESTANIQKNTIGCVEAIPKLINGKITLVCQPALYKLKPTQTVTFYRLALGIQGMLLKLLTESLLELQIGSETVVTTFNTKILGTIMTKENYAIMMSDIKNHDKVLAMYLPDLNTGKMAKIFLPYVDNIKKIAKVPKLSSFNPYKKNTSGKKS